MLLYVHPIHHLLSLVITWCHTSADRFARDPSVSDCDSDNWAQCSMITFDIPHWRN